MDKSKQPGINVDAVILKEINFNRNTNMNDTGLNISLDSGSNISDDRKKLIYELACKLTDKSESFHLNCTMVGVFSIDESKGNMDFQQFSENHAPAILFPYLRETITSITTKAGLAPVILPPLNILALINKNEDSKEKS